MKPLKKYIKIQFLYNRHDYGVLLRNIRPIGNRVHLYWSHYLSIEGNIYNILVITNDLR